MTFYQLSGENCAHRLTSGTDAQNTTTTFTSGIADTGLAELTTDRTMKTMADKTRVIAKNRG